MATTYDPLTEVGQVRLLISDVGGEDKKDFIFEDNEIEAFLAMAGGVMLAAAQALRTIAANTAMVLKVIKFMELATDGAKTADALLKTADKFEERAEEDEEDIDIISMNLGPTSEDELSLNHILRTES